MASVPAIAVILPVFNREAAIARAVGSVLAQSFTDFELIVVDDGSTDGSAAAAMASRDPRVRLVRLSENRGSNAARNAGIRAARAPLLAFLDSDDVYLADKLAAVDRIFAERPELDALLDSFFKIVAGGRNRKRRNPVIDDSEAFVAALFARRLWKATTAITVRREAALRAGLFDETLRRRQDLDFLVRVARVGPCASTDRILWHKHSTPGAISIDPAGFAAVTIDLTRRYPEYRSNPAYRIGLSRDVTRHLGRLLWRGRIGAARSDARALAAEFGRGELRQMLREGTGELVERNLLRPFRRAR